MQRERLCQCCDVWLKIGRFPTYRATRGSGAIRRRRLCRTCRQDQNAPSLSRYREAQRST
jgi:hypothetical protein